MNLIEDFMVALSARRAAAGASDAAYEDAGLSKEARHAVYDVQRKAAQAVRDSLAALEVWYEDQPQDSLNPDALAALGILHRYGGYDLHGPWCTCDFDDHYEECPIEVARRADEEEREAS